MIWKRFQLGSPISKVTDAVTVWQTERGIIEISRDTLAVPITLEDQRRGYVFHGQGRLLLDAIVETDEGAVGESVEKQLNEPFLMIGDDEDVQKQLIEASDEDLEKMNYGSQHEFMDRAEDLCDRFFKGRTRQDHRFSANGNCFIFAFQNQTDKLDILLSKDFKMVYKATGLVFVSNRSRVVLKSPSGLVCSNKGKSVIIKS